MHKQVLTLTLAALISPLALAQPDAGEPVMPKGVLSAAQLATRVVGNTIRFVDTPAEVVDEYLAPDGSLRGMSKTKGRFVGIWEIKFGNMLCFVHDDPNENGCVNVVLKGNTITLYRRDAIIEGPFTWRRGNPEKL